MYEVGLKTSAAKALRRVPRKDQQRLHTELRRLADDPRPPSCRKLAGHTDAWRVRVGDYRTVYLVDDEAQTVTVARLGHRRDIYDRR